MSGPDFRIPLAAVRQAHIEHEAGWSLRALSRLRYREWGYKTPESALEGLRRALRVLDLPVRDRVEAVVDASLVHGNARRAMKRPDHPEHARQLEHRRRTRKAGS